MIRSIFYLLFFLLILAGCDPSPENETSGNDSGEKTNKVTKGPPGEVTSASLLRNDSNFHTVEIKQMKFVPQELKVHKGDTILWVNNDIVTHDVTEEKNKTWTSSPMPVGASWKMVASKSADYYCSIHVVMKGKIMVE